MDKEIKISEAIREFILKLDEYSPQKLDTIKIEVPYYLYKEIEYELGDRFSQYQVGPNEKPLIITIFGSNIKVEVGCKEVNDFLVQEKLQQCFKILTSYYDGK